jgi:tetratricopeptide (TPR) repeat protein
LKRLEREHDNLRSAFQWALDRGAAESAARLGGALWRFWEVYGYLSEGRLWLERALSETGRVSTAARAWVLLGAGGLAVYQGDFASAAVRLEESLALARELGDQRSTAHALVFLGWAAFEQGDLAGATARLEESLVLSQELGDSWCIRTALVRLGITAWFQGDLASAMARLEEGLSLSREIGELNHTAWCLSFLGGVALSQGDATRATQLIEESLSLFQRQGDTQGKVWALHTLGEAARAQGDHISAAANYVASLKIFRERRDNVGIARSLEDLASIAEARGQPERAVRLCGAAEALSEAIGSPIPAPERPIYERTVAAAHAQLDEATCAAAWAEGRALSLEQAIAEALGVEEADVLTVGCTPATRRR